MKRKLLTFLSAVSLALSVATLILWVRSFRKEDIVNLGHRPQLTFTSWDADVELWVSYGKVWSVPHAAIFFLALALPLYRSVARRRLRARERRNQHLRSLDLCPSCGYNLRGNVSGVCPECGTPTGPREEVLPT